MVAMNAFKLSVALSHSVVNSAVEAVCASILALYASSSLTAVSYAALSSDLPKLKTLSDTVEKIKSELPELPMNKIARYIKEFGMSETEYRRFQQQ